MAFTFESGKEVRSFIIHVLTLMRLDMCLRSQERFPHSLDILDTEYTSVMTFPLCRRNFT
jgi:hypothetical protein